VICISRAIGAGGDAIGKLVAERLGFLYVDEQIIMLAARQAQIDRPSSRPRSNGSRCCSA